MPKFKTRYGWVEFPASRNPKKRGKGKQKQRRKARASARKASRPKTNPMACSRSKKVGRWRVEVKGRTVHAAGAKHSYVDSAAACRVYKAMTSMAKVENFVRKYGKKATRKAVVGAPKKRVTRKTSKRVTKKASRRRRNAPISKRDAAAISRILRGHGYF